MPSPFYNAIKGATAGTPGTGAYTPSGTPSAGFRAWTTSVPVGWIGLVRYEDGSAWELTYSYWNGTTLSRASSQMFASSTGSILSLTSSATAALVSDALEVMSHVGTTPWGQWRAVAGATTASAHGLTAPTATTGGSAATAGAISGTNYLTQQPRIVLTSVSTANGQAGVTSTTATALYSTTAGMGGFEMTTRFGATTLPTNPRLFVAMTGTSYLASTAEPGAFGANYAGFAKDSTDTNIQLLVNSASGSGTKTDTGISLVANGWYEMTVWAEPGGGTIYGLLIRLDTGAIWFGSTTTDIPTTNTALFPQVIGGLSATTGTSFALNFGSMILKMGS